MIVSVGRGGSVSSFAILEDPVGSYVRVSFSILITTGEVCGLAPVIGTSTILYPA